MNWHRGDIAGHVSMARPGTNANKYDDWHETNLGHLCLDMESQAIFGLADIKPGDTALDMGCGTGVFSLEAARRGAHTIGIDSSPAMLAIASPKAENSNLPVSFLGTDAEKMPFPSESFDFQLWLNSRETEIAVRLTYLFLLKVQCLTIGLFV